MTLIKKSAAVAAVLICTSTVSFAQNGIFENVTPKKPELKTLTQYNNYVKTLDLAQISPEDKRWLETRYNKLVDAMDAKYHRTTADKTSVSNNVSPTYSYVDSKVAMQKSVDSKRTAGSK